jgi:hypothetical protein
MRHRFVVSTLVVIGLVGGSVGITWAAGNRISAEESLTLYSETLKFKTVDVPPRGFSVGDQDVVLDELWSDPGKTTSVGRDRVVSEYIQNNYVMVQVEYTIEGRGKVYAAGTLHFSQSFLDTGDDLAITGGTGEFENVHGSVHLSVFDNETFQNDIHLLP